jgi:hypothetical protein
VSTDGLDSSHRAPIDDPVFGHATWDPAQKNWTFTVVLPSGRKVEGFLDAEGPDVPLSSAFFDRARAQVGWVCKNDEMLRQHVADRMYDLMLDWHNDESGPPLSKEQFREAIALSCMIVMDDDLVALHFDDARLFGGHSITFSIGADGEFEEEPYLWG